MESLADKSAVGKTAAPLSGSGGHDPLDIYRETRAVRVSPDASGAVFALASPASRVAAPLSSPAPASPASLPKTKKITPDKTFSDEEKRLWRLDQYALVDRRARAARSVLLSYVNAPGISEEERDARFKDMKSLICCEKKLDKTQTFSLARYGDYVAPRGLKRCKSRWACPRCASRLLYGETVELRELFEAIQRENVERAAALRPSVSALFVTLTMPHVPGDDLRWLMGVLSSSFSSVLHNRRPVRRMLERYGFAGSVRCFDFTCSFVDREGVLYRTFTGSPLVDFHPHLHCVLLFEDGGALRDEAALCEFREVMFSAWSDVVYTETRKDGAGLGRRPLDVAFDVELIGLEDGEAAAVADYAAKVIALPGYMTKSQRERGAVETTPGRSLAPFELLDAIAEGDSRFSYDTAWLLYVMGTRGFKRINWSTGLKGRWGIGRPDEVPDIEFVLPPAIAAAASHDNELMSDLCAALYDGDFSALFSTLRDNSLENYVMGIVPRVVEDLPSDDELALLRLRQERELDPAAYREKSERASRIVEARKRERVRDLEDAVNDATWSLWSGYREFVSRDRERKKTDVPVGTLSVVG